MSVSSTTVSREKRRAVPDLAWIGFIIGAAEAIGSKLGRLVESGQLGPDTERALSRHLGART